MNTQQVNVLLLGLSQERQVRLQQEAQKIHQIKLLNQPPLPVSPRRGRWQLRNAQFILGWIIYG